MPNEFTTEDLLAVFALQRLPEKTNVYIDANGWQLRDLNVVTLASGVTAAELRKALEERAAPTAEEALAALNRIVVPGTLEDYEPETVADWRTACRYIERTKGKADG